MEGVEAAAAVTASLEHSPRPPHATLRKASMAMDFVHTLAHVADAFYHTVAQVCLPCVRCFNAWRALLDGEHRAMGMRAHLGRDAADHYPANSADAAPPHDHHIDGGIIDVVQSAPRRIARSTHRPGPRFG